MKRLCCIILIFALLSSLGIASNAKTSIYYEAESIDVDVPYGDEPFDVDAKSAVLMEASTGKVLYSKNENSALPPASVTKIMTLLLACEAYDEGRFTLDKKVRISKEAAAMGGSQVFLEEGEEVAVEELFKSTIIASANDSAVALAELVSGSVDAFVRKMNARAMELSLASCHFENVTGLDDTTKNHVMSAYDIAVISRELIKHDIILKYSSLWQDSIRDGEFTLTNTNRLVRYYDGCNGLKTGSTDKAGYCVTATAKRDGMQLIAVVMGSPTRDIRNSCAKKLLDYGFTEYQLQGYEEEYLESVPVIFGKADAVKLYSGAVSFLTSRGSKIEKKYDIPTELTAPTEPSSPVGRVDYISNGKVIATAPIYVKQTVERLSFFDLFFKFVSVIISVCDS